MRRKILSLILAALLTLSVMSAALAEDASQPLSIAEQGMLSLIHI